MSYQTWYLINIGCAILIVYFLYRLAKLIYSNYGTRAVIFFFILVGSLLGFIAEKRVDNLQVWNFKTGDNIRFFQQNYTEVLENNSAFKIQLNLISLNDKDRKDERPIKAFSAVSGTSFYNKWIPRNIAIETTESNFNYTVTGEINWRFLNYTVYKEQKIFRGQIKKG